MIFILLFLKGSTGLQGVRGDNGTTGPSGKTVLTGIFFFTS